MIILKYEKQENAKYISHIDLLKQINRIMKRAKVNVVFSKGFNPHMNIYFSPALPLGVSSKCEYCTVDTDFLDLEILNEVSIKGLKFVEKFETEKNPNLANKIVFADYKINQKLSDEEVKILNDFLNQEEIFISKFRKGKFVKKEIKSLIKDFNITNENAYFRLATGEANLRIDNLINTINEETNLNLKLNATLKTNQFVNFNQGLKDVDVLLSELNK